VIDVAAMCSPDSVAGPTPALGDLEPWIGPLLRLISEQGAVPLDQLARFIGCEPHQARAIVNHLSDHRLIDLRRILHDEPAWLWLTWRGTCLSGTGLAYLEPRVGALARLRAVNEIRLHIAARAPEALWTCGRSVFRGQGSRGHRIHAVVEHEGERHGLLALHAAKSSESLLTLIEAHLPRYDALIAFTAPRPRRQLARLANRHHWPTLLVRDLPETPRKRGANHSRLSSLLHEDT
jgi:hypothetical protein